MVMMHRTQEVTRASLKGCVVPATRRELRALTQPLPGGAAETNPSSLPQGEAA